MKIRRRLSSGSGWSRWWSWFRPAEWFRRTRARATNADAAEGADAAAAADAAPVGDESQRQSVGLRRLFGRPPDPTTGGSGGFWRSVWVFPSAFVVFAIAGYVLAAFAFFPAPFLSASIAIPQVVGMNQDDAEEALINAGFTRGETELVNHPLAPNGQVVWQDPASGMILAQGTSIRLGVSGGPQQIPVPDVSGYQVDIARSLIEASGLSVGRIEGVQTAAPKDVAVNTRPTARATLRPGTRITLVVSLGAPTIPVPSLVGLTVEEAQDSLESVGLTLGTFWRETTSAYEEGTIFRTEPPVGTLTAPQTPVNVVVARRSP